MANNRETEIIKLNAGLAALELGYAQAKGMEQYVLGNPNLCPMTGETIDAGEWWKYLRDARRRVEWFASQIRRVHQAPRRRLGLIDRARRWIANQIMPAPYREMAWS